MLAIKEDIILFRLRGSKKNDVLFDCLAAIDAPGISKEDRQAAWKRAIDLYDLTSPTLTRGTSDAAARVPDNSNAEDVANFRDAYLAFGFSEAEIGDMWGGVWKYLGLQQRPYACIFNVFSGPEAAPKRRPRDLGIHPGWRAVPPSHLRHERG
jgi:hypothetical protein